MSPKVISTKDKLRLENKKFSTIQPKTHLTLKEARPNESSETTSTIPAKILPSSSSHSNAATNQSSQRVSKKRKRSSPFRIKVGCVVALRYRNEDPRLSLMTNEHQQQEPLDFDSFVRVWTSPVSGRDEGLALIGKRVRCHLPKVESTQKRRVLEGEITRLVDYDSDNTKKLISGRPLKVELLVDETQLQHFTFLKRLDHVDPTTLTTETAKRNHRLEENIRGKNTAIVLMKLVHPTCMSALASAGTKGNTTLGVQWAIQKLVPAKLFWESSRRSNNLEQAQSMADTTEAALGESVGQKLPTGSNGAYNKNGETGAAATVTSAAATNANGTSAALGKVSPPTLAAARESASTIAATKSINAEGKSTTTARKKNLQHVVVVRHVGDGNDSPEQQIHNWRWLASRYHHMLLSSLSSSITDQQMGQILSGGFVGEVVKVESCCNESTLARVTLRRLILPEHTVSGRLPHHGFFDIFDDHDTGQSNSGLLIDAPIEHLVIVGRKLSRLTETTVDSNSLLSAASSLDHVQLSHSYSFRDDLYRPLLGEESASSIGDRESEKDDVQAACHRCRRVQSASDMLTTCSSDQCPLSGPCSSTSTAWCSECLRVFDELLLERRNGGEAGSGGDLPCCLGVCDCRRCQSFLGSELHEDLAVAIAEASCRAPSPSASDLVDENSKKPLIFTRTLVTARSLLVPIDFGLPSDFLDLNTLPKPQVQPSTRMKSRVPNKRAAKQVGKVGRPLGSMEKKAIASETNGTNVVDTTNAQERQLEDYSVFKPSCARLLSYLDARKLQSQDYTVSSYSDRPRNLRQATLDQKKKDTEKDEKASFRATRANQRRLLKDVAAIGTSWLGVDTLASREPQLRFDRSGIHAWGVYADEDIAADEMIIEYRGEVIENAMAEKREKEYTVAKIGSDYMFRIDAQLVCDATKQGNVARFINASCDPNCYTKIITLDGNKRIVIYAKRDIRVGEELCYDYKFPLEYDQSKHIPCHCDAKDCRGFMNWDKRYALPVANSLTAPAEVQDSSKRSSDLSFESRTLSPPCAMKRAAEEGTKSFSPGMEKKPRSLSPTNPIDNGDVDTSRH